MMATEHRKNAVEKLEFALGEQSQPKTFAVKSEEFLPNISTLETDNRAFEVNIHSFHY